MKKLFKRGLVLFILLLAVVAWGSQTLYNDNVQANQPIHILQRIMTINKSVTISLSIPCNVTLSPTFLLGLGRNYSYPLITYTNVSSFVVPQGKVVYELIVVPLNSGLLTITEE